MQKLQTETTLKRLCEESLFLLRIHAGILGISILLQFKTTHGITKLIIFIKGGETESWEISLINQRKGHILSAKK